ncbi:MAG: metalloregulator ArsR/SmtB family transcription factor [Blastocatellia bacterium]|nr:metalloregulator ArsR/SmtB family transcription factor [Blastocatellia bacterium]
MGKEETLSYMEKFYTALSDKTRLRLLNLMRENEVCVCFFTEVLGDSQPKISRHLAYLRNAGLVDARRDGKWMHYSIRWPEDDAAREVLTSALAWLASQPHLKDDVARYEKVCCTPELLIQIARTPIDFLHTPEHVEDVSAKRAEEPEYSDEPDNDYPPARHNELEEFLL